MLSAQGKICGYTLHLPDNMKLRFDSLTGGISSSKKIQIKEKNK